MLFGNVLNRSMLCLLRWRRRAAFQGEDHLADFYFLAFLDPNLFHRAGHRGWHLDDRFVGFQFHDGLAFGNFGARRNHQPYQIALIDVLAQLGQPEVRCASRGRSRSRRRCWRSLADRRRRRLRNRRRFFRGRFRGWGLGPVGLGFDRLGFRSRPIFHGEDHLADFYLLAFLDANFVDRAGDGRRNLDDGFVGFQFHHGLAGGDAGAERDHQPHQVALVNIFAEFRKLKFCHWIIHSQTVSMWARAPSLVRQRHRPSTSEALARHMFFVA